MKVIRGVGFIAAAIVGGSVLGLAGTASAVPTSGEMSKQACEIE